MAPRSDGDLAGAGDRGVLSADAPHAAERAARYLARRHGLETSGFDDPAVDPGTAVELARAVDEILTRFPSVDLREVRIDELPDDGWLGAADNRVDAGGRVHTEAIVLNRTYAVDPALSQEVMAARERTGYFPEGSAASPARAVTLHELGHAVYDAGFGGSMDPKRAHSFVVSRLLDHFASTRDVVDDNGFHRWVGQLCEHSFGDGRGGTDADRRPESLHPGEAFANAFLEVEINGARASEPARVLYDLLVEAVERDSPPERDSGAPDGRSTRRGAVLGPAGGDADGESLRFSDAAAGGATARLRDVLRRSPAGTSALTVLELGSVRARLVDAGPGGHTRVDWEAGEIVVHAHDRGDVERAAELVRATELIRSLRGSRFGLGEASLQMIRAQGRDEFPDRMAHAEAVAFGRMAEFLRDMDRAGYTIGEEALGEGTDRSYRRALSEQYFAVFDRALEAERSGPDPDPGRTLLDARAAGADAVLRGGLFDDHLAAGWVGAPGREGYAALWELARAVADETPPAADGEQGAIDPAVVRVLAATDRSTLARQFADDRWADRLQRKELAAWAVDVLARHEVEIRFRSDSDAAIERRRAGTRDRLGADARYDAISGRLTLPADLPPDQVRAEVIRAAVMADAAARVDRFAMLRDEYVDAMLDRTAHGYALMAEDARRVAAGTLEGDRDVVEDPSGTALDYLYRRTYRWALETAARAFPDAGDAIRRSLRGAAFRAGVRAVRAHLDSVGPLAGGRTSSEVFRAEWDRAHGVSPERPAAVPDRVRLPRHGDPVLDNGADARRAYARLMAEEVTGFTQARQSGVDVVAGPAERVYTDAYDRALRKAERAAARVRPPATAPDPATVARRAGRRALERYLAKVGRDAAEVALDVVRADDREHTVEWGNPGFGLLEGAEGPAHLPDDVHASLARAALERVRGRKTWLSDHVIRRDVFGVPMVHVAAERGRHTEVFQAVWERHPELRYVWWDQSTMLKWLEVGVGVAEESGTARADVTGPYRRPQADDIIARLVTRYLHGRRTGRIADDLDTWLTRSEAVTDPASGEVAIAPQLLDRAFESARGESADPAAPPPDPFTPEAVLLDLLEQRRPLIQPGPGDGSGRREPEFEIAIVSTATVYFPIWVQPDASGRWRIPEPTAAGTVSDAIALAMPGLSASSRLELIGMVEQRLRSEPDGRSLSGVGDDPGGDPGSWEWDLPWENRHPELAGAGAGGGVPPGGKLPTPVAEPPDDGEPSSADPRDPEAADGGARQRPASVADAGGADVRTGIEGGAGHPASRHGTAREPGGPPADSRPADPERAPVTGERADGGEVAGDAGRPGLGARPEDDRAWSGAFAERMRVEQAEWEARMAADRAAWLRALADSAPDDPWAALRAEQGEWSARMAADRAEWLRRVLIGPSASDIAPDLGEPGATVERTAAEPVTEHVAEPVAARAAEPAAEGAAEPAAEPAVVLDSGGNDLVAPPDWTRLPLPEIITFLRETMPREPVDPGLADADRAFLARFADGLGLGERLTGHPDPLGALAAFAREVADRGLLDTVLAPPSGASAEPTGVARLRSPGELASDLSARLGLDAGALAPGALADAVAAEQFRALVRAATVAALGEAVVLRDAAADRDAVAPGASVRAQDAVLSWAARLGVRAEQVSTSTAAATIERLRADVLDRVAGITDLADAVLAGARGEAGRHTVDLGGERVPVRLVDDGRGGWRAEPAPLLRPAPLVTEPGTIVPARRSMLRRVWEALRTGFGAPHRDSAAEAGPRETGDGVARWRAREHTALWSRLTARTSAEAGDPAPMIGLDGNEYAPWIDEADARYLREIRAELAEAGLDGGAPPERIDTVGAAPEFPVGAGAAAEGGTGISIIEGRAGDLPPWAEELARDLRDRAAVADSLRATAAGLGLRLPDVTPGSLRRVVSDAHYTRARRAGAIEALADSVLRYEAADAERPYPRGAAERDRGLDPDLAAQRERVRQERSLWARMLGVDTADLRPGRWDATLAALRGEHARRGDLLDHLELMAGRFAAPHAVDRVHVLPGDPGRLLVVGEPGHHEAALARALADDAGLAGELERGERVVEFHAGLFDGDTVHVVEIDAPDVRHVRAEVDGRLAVLTLVRDADGPWRVVRDPAGETVDGESGGAAAPTTDTAREVAEPVGAARGVPGPAPLLAAERAETARRLGVDEARTRTPEGLAGLWQDELVRALRVEALVDYVRTADAIARYHTLDAAVDRLAAGAGLRRDELTPEAFAEAVVAPGTRGATRARLLRALAEYARVVRDVDGGAVDAALRRLAHDVGVPVERLRARRYTPDLRHLALDPSGVDAAALRAALRPLVRAPADRAAAADALTRYLRTLGTVDPFTDGLRRAPGADPRVADGELPVHDQGARAYLDELSGGIGHFAPVESDRAAPPRLPDADFDRLLGVRGVPAALGRPPAPAEASPDGSVDLQALAEVHAELRTEIRRRVADLRRLADGIADQNTTETERTESAAVRPDPAPSSTIAAQAHRPAREPTAADRSSMDTAADPTTETTIFPPGIAGPVASQAAGRETGARTESGVMPAETAELSSETVPLPSDGGAGEPLDRPRRAAPGPDDPDDSGSDATDVGSGSHRADSVLAGAPPDRAEYDALVAERRDLTREREFIRAKVDDRASNLGLADPTAWVMRDPEDRQRSILDLDARSRVDVVDIEGGMEEASRQVEQAVDPAERQRRRLIIEKLVADAGRFDQLAERIAELDRRIAGLEAAGIAPDRPALRELAAELDRLARDRATTLRHIKPRREMRDDLAVRLGIVDADGRADTDALAPERLDRVVRRLRGQVQYDVLRGAIDAAAARVRRTAIDVLAEAGDDVNRAHNLAGRLQDEMARITGLWERFIAAEGGEMIALGVGLVDGDRPRLVVFAGRDEHGAPPRAALDRTLAAALRGNERVTRLLVREEVTVELRRVLADRDGLVRVLDVGEVEVRRMRTPWHDATRFDLTLWRDGTGTWQAFDETRPSWQLGRDTGTVPKKFTPKDPPDGVSGWAMEDVVNDITLPTDDVPPGQIPESTLPVNAPMAPSQYNTMGLDEDQIYAQHWGADSYNVVRLILMLAQAPSHPAVRRWVQSHPAIGEWVKSKPWLRHIPPFGTFLRNFPWTAPPERDIQPLHRPWTAAEHAPPHLRPRIPESLQRSWDADVARWQQVQRWAAERYAEFLDSDADVYAIYAELGRRRLDAQLTAANEVVDAVRTQLVRSHRGIDPLGDIDAQMRAVRDEIERVARALAPRFATGDAETVTKTVADIRELLSDGVRPELIAEMLAESMRHDVTEFGMDDLRRIKRHLMEDEHRVRDYADPAGAIVHRRADPVADVAEAWSRLIAGRPLRQDLVLLRDAHAEARFLDEHPTATWQEANAHAVALGHHWDADRPPLTGDRAGIPYAPAPVPPNPAYQQPDRGDRAVESAAAERTAVEPQRAEPPALEQARSEPDTLAPLLTERVAAEPAREQSRAADERDAVARLLRPEEPASAPGGDIVSSSRLGEVPRPEPLAGDSDVAEGRVADPARQRDRSPGRGSRSEDQAHARGADPAVRLEAAVRRELDAFDRTMREREATALRALDDALARLAHQRETYERGAADRLDDLARNTEREQEAIRESTARDLDELSAATAARFDELAYRLGLTPAARFDRAIRETIDAFDSLRDHTRARLDAVAAETAAEFDALAERLGLVGDTASEARHDPESVPEPDVFDERLAALAHRIDSELDALHRGLLDRLDEIQSRAEQRLAAITDPRPTAAPPRRGVTPPEAAAESPAERADSGGRRDAPDDQDRSADPDRSGDQEDPGSEGGTPASPSSGPRSGPPRGPAPGAHGARAAAPPATPPAPGRTSDDGASGDTASDAPRHHPGTLPLAGVPGPDGVPDGAAGGRAAGDLPPQVRELERRYGLETSGFDDPAVDRRITRDFARVVAETLDRFPEIDPRAVRIGELPDSSWLAMTTVRLGADGRLYTDAITLSRSYATDLAGLGIAVAGLVSDGRMPEGAERDPVRAVVEHELGHALDNAGLVTWLDPAAAQRRLILHLLDHFRATRPDFDPDAFHRWMTQLSGQAFGGDETKHLASFDPAEALADAYVTVERLGRAAPEPARVLYELLIDGLRAPARHDGPFDGSGTDLPLEEHSRGPGSLPEEPFTANQAGRAERRPLDAGPPESASGRKGGSPASVTPPGSSAANPEPESSRPLRADLEEPEDSGARPADDAARFAAAEEPLRALGLDPRAYGPETLAATHAELSYRTRSRAGAIEALAALAQRYNDAARQVPADTATMDRLSAERYVWMDIVGVSPPELAPDQLAATIERLRAETVRVAERLDQLSSVIGDSTARAASAYALPARDSLGLPADDRAAAVELARRLGPGEPAGGVTETADAVAAMRRDNATRAAQAAALADYAHLVVDRTVAAWAAGRQFAPGTGVLAGGPAPVRTPEISIPFVAAVGADSAARPGAEGSVWIADRHRILRDGTLTDPAGYAARERGTVTALRARVAESGSADPGVVVRLREEVDRRRTMLEVFAGGDRPVVREELLERLRADVELRTAELTAARGGDGRARPQSVIEAGLVRRREWLAVAEGVTPGMNGGRVHTAIEQIRAEIITRQARVIAEAAPPDARAAELDRLRNWLDAVQSRAHRPDPARLEAIHTALAGERDRLRRGLAAAASTDVSRSGSEAARRARTEGARLAVVAEMLRAAADTPIGHEQERLAEAARLRAEIEGRTEEFAMLRMANTDADTMRLRGLELAALHATVELRESQARLDPGLVRILREEILTGIAHRAHTAIDTAYAGVRDEIATRAAEIDVLESLSPDGDADQWRTLSASEVGELLMRRYGLDAWGFADPAVDAEVAREFGRTVDDVLRRYPAIDLGGVHIDAMPASEKAETGPAIEAGGRRFTEYIMLNRAYAMDADGLRAVLAEEVASGFHTEAYARHPIRALISHELGHALARAGSPVLGQLTPGDVLDMLRAFHRGAHPAGDFRDWLLRLSRYSFAGDHDRRLESFDPREAFADAFAEVEILATEASEPARVLYTILVTAAERATGRSASGGSEHLRVTLPEGSAGWLER